MNMTRGITRALLDFQATSLTFCPSSFFHAFGCHGDKHVKRWGPTSRWNQTWATERARLGIGSYNTTSPLDTDSSSYRGIVGGSRAGLHGLATPQSNAIALDAHSSRASTWCKTTSSSKPCSKLIALLAFVTWFAQRLSSLCFLS